MLKSILLSINILSASIIIACTCPYQVSEFCHGADSTDFIGLFEVIDKPDESYIILSLIENINKEFPEDTIELIGYAGNQCGGDVDIFNIGDSVIFNANFSDYDMFHDHTGKVFNWWFGDCWKEHLWYSNGNVFGPVTDQIDTMDYNEFKENLFTCLDFFLSTSKIDDKKLRLYPNPTSDIINIEISENLEYEVTVYNSSGNICPVELNRNGFVTSVNLSLLNNGIYFIRLRRENEIVCRKIVKL